MTDETSPDWLKLQQQYWETYLNMTHQAVQDTAKATTDSTSNSSPWVNTLDIYWKTLSPLVQPEAKDVLEKFVTQGQQFFHFATTFLKVFHQAPHDADPELWQQYFDELKQTLADFTNEQHQGLSFWELPLDNWQRAVGTLSLLPNDFFQNLKPHNLSQELHENVQRWLSTPGVGCTREWQDQLQESTRLWMIYQKAHQEYRNILSRVGTRTVDLMQEKAVKLQEDHKKIENLRQLYDLWVDCGEIAYAEIVNTDEYAEINARLVNTLMAWKKHERSMIDDLLSSMNMPTRKELDSLHLRLQQLRRETRILKAKQYEERIDDLQSELVKLRTEMDALKKHVDTPKKTTTRRRTTTRTRKASPSTKPKTGE
ncbi:class III poly(R)-hydroxyalkanoic acid synthase subunit PhaE [Candidatus Albibeggiatoa sp. nov. NOAA]|uniref:class III poly(R)-hydroxyalkanoic acid synthase subunit PhaE n=1 Tax=Candidatus Albibeggiatoa sp. nov. NOAA TaxID=3162724 RepID=UPI0032F3D4C1|nr:class III poly(R)-hydroxyalkanoic acid synthase subunit PhaE [Thiotrichaceae bacterium]